MRIALGHFQVTVVEFTDLLLGTLPDASTYTADEDHLTSLASLLAADVDHRLRIASGDICIWVPNESGAPAGLAWINLRSHSDQYLGRWSRPDSQTAYFNQLFVSSNSRNQGFGRRLIVGGLHAAAAAGRHVVRSAIPHGNAASLHLHHKVGFEAMANVVGIRLGDQVTIRLSKRILTPRRPSTTTDLPG